MNLQNYISISNEGEGILHTIFSIIRCILTEKYRKTEISEKHFKRFQSFNLLAALNYGIQ